MSAKPGRASSGSANSRLHHEQDVARQAKSARRGRGRSKKKQNGVLIGLCCASALLLILVVVGMMSGTKEKAPVKDPGPGNLGPALFSEGLE